MGEESSTANAYRHLNQRIAKILNDTRTLYATHNRKLKELAGIRSKLSSPNSDEPSLLLRRRFSAAFFKNLTPLFVSAQRRTAASERLERFAAEFACLRSDS